MPVHHKREKLSFIVQACDDVPGEWVAIGLEFDSIAQGETLVEALSLARESAKIFYREWRASGRDLSEIEQAPDEFQQLGERIMCSGKAVQCTLEELSVVAQDDLGRQCVYLFRIDEELPYDLEVIQGGRSTTRSTRDRLLTWKTCRAEVG